MTIRYALVLSALFGSFGCTEGALSADPEAAVARGGRARLHTGFVDYDGLRFRDGAVISKRIVWNGASMTTEVRAADGALLEGEASRTDLELRSGRGTSLECEGECLCLLPGRFSSVGFIGAAGCSDFQGTQFLQWVSDFGTSPIDQGFIFRSAAGTYALRIVESGRDSVVLDYEPAE